MKRLTHKSLVSFLEEKGFARVSARGLLQRQPLYFNELLKATIENDDFEKSAFIRDMDKSDMEFYIKLDTTEGLSFKVFHIEKRQVYTEKMYEQIFKSIGFRPHPTSLKQYNKIAAGN